MSYLEGYNTGVIIGIIITIIIIIYFIGKKVQVNQLWEQRVKDVTKNRDVFYSELKTKGFATEIDFIRSAFYHTSAPIEVFALKADLTKKKLAIGSFDDADNFKIFSFSEIKGFSIIDGERNTTMESYTIGGATGRFGIVGGVANTSTYQETTVGNIKLKIETDDIKNSIYIFPINKYNIDVKSESYSDLINTIEKIKSFLTKIIDENKK